MPRLLFTVEHTCVLPRHGIALFPGFAPVGEERFRIGSSVRLKRPDGSELLADIAGIELPTPNPQRVLVPWFKLSANEVPVGTQVWYHTAEITVVEGR